MVFLFVCGDCVGFPFKADFVINYSNLVFSDQAKSNKSTNYLQNKRYLHIINSRCQQ